LHGVIASAITAAAPPPSEPVVARVEMKLANDEEVIDVIEKGDLLTILEERDDDYVVMTYSGVKGAVDKVNAVAIAESGDIYTELIEANPEEGRYYTLRASSWWALGKPEQALADFDKAIELGYERSHAYASRGLFYASSGKYDKAIADYDKALELDPEDLSPLINRAAVNISRGKLEDAIADYSSALEQKRERKENITSLLRQRAIAYKAAGKADEAIADFDALLKLNPKDFAAVMGRGYVHFQQKNHAAAVEDFSRAIEINGNDPVARNNRGYNLFQLGKHADAIQDYDEALRLEPKYGLALQNRAWLLATTDNEELRDPELAVQSAKAACELSNYENISDLSVLAASLAAAGKFAEAVGWQEKVVQMVGENYKSFAEKTLVRYQNEQPFAVDIDAADVK
jgi:tetratricopeptide (TPR) repeat protein